MRTLLAIIACAQLHAPDSVSAAPARASAAPTVVDAAFARRAAAAGAVFEGKVVAIGPAPGAWSGLAIAFQDVTYRVTKLHRGADHRLRVGALLTVRHWIVARSRTADREPRLRPDLVHPGATVIVLADWDADDEAWTGVDEHHGIVAADAAHRAALARPR